MLSLAELRAEAGRVTYKPGWSFEVYEDPWEGPTVHIVARGLPNGYRPAEPLDLGVRSAIPPIPDTDYFHEWMKWRLRRIETHELREFYRVDGALVDDPHAEASPR